MPWMVLWPSGADIGSGWAQGETLFVAAVNAFVPPPASGKGRWRLLTVAPLRW